MKCYWKIIDFHSRNDFENIVCEMAAILSRFQCDKQSVHDWNSVIDIETTQSFAYRLAPPGSGASAGAAIACPAMWRKIVDCACAGNAGNVFPATYFMGKPLVSDPGMHHGTCVTHVSWCMSGSLTRGGGENLPGIPGACAARNLRIWQEAHRIWWLYRSALVE